MPTGAYARQDEAQHDEDRRAASDRATPTTTQEEEGRRLVQLRDVVQQRPVLATTTTTTTTTMNNANNIRADHASGAARDAVSTVLPPPPTDGAHNPVTPGTGYASLRRITRRQPRDLDAVLDGVDTSSADLSWAGTPAGPGGLDPKGRPWAYPKTRGRLGSNLDEFRDEIETRTRKGEGCRAIADALTAMGVETSSRAVARQRMKWGLRQRAPRRMTEQGLANIRRAHLDHARRLANSDPVPVKRVRIRVLRKAEITRMTREGLSAAQIAENLSARGVRLKRGAATVERLRTVWGLTEDAQRSVENIRGTARNRAAKAQREQFESIARELGVVDVEGWVGSKMSEEPARDARRAYAYTLMGDARPKPTTIHDPDHGSAAQRKGDGAMSGDVLTRLPGVDFLPHTFDPIFTPPVQDDMAPTGAARDPVPALAGTDALQEVMEVSSDEGDSDSDSDQETLGGQGTDAGGAREDQHDTQVPVESQVGAPMDLVVDPSASLQRHSGQANGHVQQGGGSLPALSALQVVTSTNNTTTTTATTTASSMTPDPHFDDSDGFAKPWEDGGPGSPERHHVDGSLGRLEATGAPPSPEAPGRRFVPIAPRLTSLRPLAPRPLTPLPILAQPQKPEADYMAQFGLFPYPTHGKPPQKYLTPTGLITTQGYEYLAAPTGLPAPDVINIMPASAPPLPPPPVPPVPPVPAKVSQVPAPPLIMSAEEVGKHKEDLGTIEGCYRLTQECMDLLAARVDSRPATNSLTGMPPSLRQIQDAKERLKEAAGSLLAML